MGGEDNADYDQLLTKVDATKDWLYLTSGRANSAVHFLDPDLSQEKVSLQLIPHSCLVFPPCFISASLTLLF